MRYAIHLADDGRILFVTDEEQAGIGAIIVDALPDGNRTDYRFVDGAFVHDPLPEVEDPPKNDYEARIASLEEELAAAKILLGVE